MGRASTPSRVSAATWACTWALSPRATPARPSWTACLGLSRSSSRPSPPSRTETVREAAHLSEKVREAPGCAGSHTVRQTNRLLVGAIGRGDLGERWGWGYKRGLEHRSL